MDLTLLVDVLLWGLAALLVAAGLAGLLLPAVPGPLLVFAGLLTAAWIEDYLYVGWRTLTIIALLAALSYVADFVAGALGASKFGASPRAVWGAIFGGVIGIFFGLIGIVLAPFVGAVLGELSARRTVGEAGRAGLGTTLGLLLGVALKLALVVTMIGIFLLVRFL